MNFGKIDTFYEMWGFMCINDFDYEFGTLMVNFELDCDPNYELKS